jgi:hypothetical protein
MGMAKSHTPQMGFLMSAQLVEEDCGGAVLVVTVVIVGDVIDIALAVDELEVEVEVEVAVQAVEKIVDVLGRVELACVLRGRLSGRKGAHSVGISRAFCLLRAHAAMKAPSNSGGVSSERRELPLPGYLLPSRSWGSVHSSKRQ